MKHVLYFTSALLLFVGCSQLDIPSRCSCGNNNEVLIVEPQEIEETGLPDTIVAESHDGEKAVTHDSEEKKPMTETWLPLFDGDETMPGWMVPVYGGDGEVDVREGNIVIGRGEMMTGIRYEKEFPKNNYEIQYEARRTQGYDFFAACTFPVKESFCTFINGGWGGSTIGLSSVNGYDASDNQTSTNNIFKEKLWYRFRIRVTEEMIQVWMTPQNKDGNWETEKSIIELELEDRKLSTRYEVDRYKPLGFCTWNTEGQIRKIEYREIGK